MVHPGNTSVLKREIKVVSKLLHKLTVWTALRYVMNLLETTKIFRFMRHASKD